MLTALAAIFRRADGAETGGSLMDVAITIIIGFGSAIVGALVGFFGSTYQERRRVTELRGGMVKAVTFEMTTNCAYAAQALKSRERPFSFTEMAWNAANFELAQFLKPIEYQNVGVTYMGLSGIDTMVRLAEEKGTLPDPARLAIVEWLNHSVETMSSLITSYPERFKDWGGLLLIANLVKEADLTQPAKPQG